MSILQAFIGNGVALNIPYFIKELEAVVSQGVPEPKILISERAQLLMPYHILQDTYEEERLAGRAYGSTKSGIAPFYSDKYAKIGIQAGEFFDDEILNERIEKICLLKNILFKHLYNKPEIDKAELRATLHSYRELIAPYLCDTSAYLAEAVKETTDRKSVV